MLAGKGQTAACGFENQGAGGLIKLYLGWIGAFVAPGDRDDVAPLCGVGHHADGVLGEGIALAVLAFDVAFFRRYSRRGQVVDAGVGCVHGMEAKLQFSRLVGLDVIDHQESCGLPEHQLPHIAAQAGFGDVCSGGVAFHEVVLGMRLGFQDCRRALDRQRHFGMEPHLVLAALSQAVDEQSVVLAGLFPAIAVVLDDPLAPGEDHKVVGVGMDMADARVAGKALGQFFVARGRTALEYDERLLA